MNIAVLRPKHYLIAMREKVVAMDLSEIIEDRDPWAETSFATSAGKAVQILLKNRISAVFFDPPFLHQPFGADLVRTASRRSTLVRLGDGTLPMGLDVSTIRSIEVPCSELAVNSMLQSIRSL
jgi:hypothetical protein